MNALHYFAIWLGLVALFMIFVALMKAGYGEDDDLDGPPPPSGA